MELLQPEKSDHSVTPLEWLVAKVPQLGLIAVVGASLVGCSAGSGVNEVRRDADFPNDPAIVKITVDGYGSKTIQETTSVVPRSSAFTEIVHNCDSARKSVLDLMFTSSTKSDQTKAAAIKALTPICNELLASLGNKDHPLRMTMTRAEILDTYTVFDGYRQFLADGPGSYESFRHESMPVKSRLDAMLATLAMKAPEKAKAPGTEPTPQDLQQKASPDDAGGNKTSQPSKG